MTIKILNKNPNKTDLWSFTKENIKDALREDTGETNCELRLQLISPNSVDLTEENKIE